MTHSPSLHAVSFSWPGQAPLLDGFELCFEAERITALVGASGCGKSTVLRLLLGLLRPGAGTVEVPAGERAMVFQQPTLLPWRTVADNVALPLELRGIGAAERRARAAEALERVGLAEVAADLPHTLSGGMRMRASVARALVTTPALLGLDEPFAALDAITRRSVREEFCRTWARRPCPAVLVTHDLDEAVLLSHRVIVVGDRPLRVRADLQVDIPWPRPASLLHAPRLGAIVEGLEAHL